LAGWNNFVVARDQSGALTRALLANESDGNTDSESGVIRGFGRKAGEIEKLSILTKLE
jgi:hypothetical protein